MAKKIVDENGNVYVQKKPFYKRVWFIVLAAIVIIVVFSNMSNSSESTKTTPTNGSQTTNTTNTTATNDSQVSSSEKPKVSAEFSAASAKAKSYSDVMYMSKAKIYEQLTSDAGEKFPTDAAQYAVDNLNADYNKNALEKAKSYQKTMNMSTEAIRDQLTSAAGEQFTPEEANYAIQHLND